MPVEFTELINNSLMLNEFKRYLAESERNIVVLVSHNNRIYEVRHTVEGSFSVTPAGENLDREGARYIEDVLNS